MKWVRDELSAIPPGQRLLDVGAGELQFAPQCAHLQYVAQDFAGYDGNGDGKGLQTATWDQSRIDIISDITAIPVHDASFDAVLCTEVLEHVPDAVAALKEMARVLRPGGTMLLTAPMASLTHFAPYHFSGYSRYWYEYHLPRLGMEIQAIEHNGSFFGFVQQEVARIRLVSRQHSSPIMGELARLLSLPLLVTLGLLRMKDRSSNDLLCFGFLVRARKR